MSANEKNLLMAVAVVLLGWMALLYMTDAEAEPIEPYHDLEYYSKGMCEGYFGGEMHATDDEFSCMNGEKVASFRWSTMDDIFLCNRDASSYSYQTGKEPVCVLFARDEVEKNLGNLFMKHFLALGVSLYVVNVEQDQAQFTRVIYDL